MRERDGKRAKPGNFSFAFPLSLSLSRFPFATHPKYKNTTPSTNACQPILKESKNKKHLFFSKHFSNSPLREGLFQTNRGPLLSFSVYHHLPPFPPNPL